MLFSSDTMQTVDRAIDDAFRGNQDEDHNSSSYKGRSTAVAAGIYVCWCMTRRKHTKHTLVPVQVVLELACVPWKVFWRV